MQIGTMIHDARYALRNLRGAPVFTATAVFTLALGIGATTAIFSVVNTVLLRPLPYPEPNRIIRAWAHTDDGDILDFTFRVDEYRELRNSTDVFDAIGAEFPASFTVLFDDQEPLQVDARMVTADFFRVFGAAPSLGSMFTTEEIAGGDALVAVVSHSFWSRYLGSDPEAIGTTLDFAGNSFTLAGVMPADYHHISGGDVDVFVPYTIGTSGWTAHWLELYGRLADGVTQQRASNDINGVLRAIGETNHRSAGWHATVEGLHEMVVGDVRPAVWALFGTVALVLLIACVNVANLTLARSATRSKEISIRKALGAGRGRIVRQLLVENLVLATIGGVVGVLAAMAGLRTLVRLAPASIPRLGAATIDPAVLAFALAVTLTTVLLFGLTPAMRASRDRAGSSSGSTRGDTVGTRLRGLLGSLVVSEVALALTLLVGDGLMVRTFAALQNEDLGFRRGGALTFRVTAPSARYPSSKETAGFYRQLHEALLHLPNVTAVGAGTDLPVSGEGAVASANSENRFVAGIEEAVTALQRRATVGYFEALGTPILEGREFNSHDHADGETVAIISASLSRALFPDGGAVGQRVTFGWAPTDEDDWMRVVGVAADIRFRSADRVDEAHIYQAHSQSSTRDMAVIVRTSDDPRALLEPAKAALRALDSEVPIFQIETLQAVVDRSLAGRRFTMSLFSLFAIVALLLTVAGIYGVLVFVVGRRRTEIGVRMALGARSQDVTRLVVRQGMTLVAGGLTLGLLGALAASRLLQGLLYGVDANDPWTYVGVVAILLAVSLAACYLPARQGARVSPIAVLRQ